MKDKVEIVMETVQISEDLEEQRSTLKAAGMFRKKEHRRCLFYEEIPEEDSAEPDKVRMIWDSRRIKLKKKGRSEWEMEFEAGADWSSPYHTPYGTIQTRIHTQRLEIQETEEVIMLEIVYHLILQESYEADCHMQIRITPLA